MNLFNRRFKGAISIFLVIILVANYALVGLLVDSGRQRMARANAEMALDSAANSVLSYYNKMLFDLYGLFATDSLSVDDIDALLTDYTSKTLGIIGVDEHTTTKLTQAIQSVVSDSIGSEIFDKSNLFDGFDYNFEIEVDQDQCVTLANTAFVEAQIIDHMKYRAPISMAQGASNFLENIHVILDIKDRVTLSKERIKDTEEKDQLAQDASDLIKDVEAFEQELRNYCSENGKAYDPWVTIDEIDKGFNEIANTYSSQVIDDDYTEDDFKEDLSKEYQKKYKNFLGSWKIVASDAEAIYNWANRLRDQAQNLEKRYTAYINRLQAKIDADKENQNVKTVYAPEVEIAQTTCGEMLKNMGLVVASRPYLKDISEKFLDSNRYYNDAHFTDNFIEGAVAKIIDVHINGSTSDSRIGTLRSYINSGDPGVFVSEAKEGMDSLTDDFVKLLQLVNTYETPEKPELKTVNDAKYEEKEDEVNDEILRDLKEDDLSVAFQTLSEQWDGEICAEMNEDNTSKLLEAMEKLLTKIGDVLENARDSLYIDEYIIEYFPNYVQHYKAIDSDLAKNASNARLIDPKSYYSAFNASQAELEFVVGGQHTEASLNVASVSAKLLALRMGLNTVAIFTDSAKVMQANSLALAISGPFAPAVSVALLIAWALAESALDVIDLLNGEKVIIFKQGADWTISLGGGIKKVVKEAAKYIGDSIADELNEKIEDGSAIAKQAADRAVYEAYHYAASAGSNADAAVAEAKRRAMSSINQWSDDLSSVMSADGGSADAAGLRNSASEAVNSAFSSVPSVTGLIDDAKDKVLVEVDNGINKVEKKLKTKTKELSSKYADKFSDWAAKGLSKYFDVGNAVNTGSSDSKSPRMDYIDHMRIFLLFYSNEFKTQCVQRLIQANIRYGGTNCEGFLMAESYGSVHATMTGDISILFMSNAILPSSLKRNGRLRFSAVTGLSY